MPYIKYLSFASSHLCFISSHLYIAYLHVLLRIFTSTPHMFTSMYASLLHICASLLHIYASLLHTYASVAASTKLAMARQCCSLVYVLSLMETTSNSGLNTNIKMNDANQNTIRKTLPQRLSSCIPHLSKLLHGSSNSDPWGGGGG
jgi:hypothetical protein